MMKGKVKASNRKKAKNVFQETSLKLTLLVSRQMEMGSKPVNLTRARTTEKIVLTIHDVSLPSAPLELLLDVGSILTSILGRFDRDSSKCCSYTWQMRTELVDPLKGVYILSTSPVCLMSCATTFNFAEGVCPIALLAAQYLNSLNFIFPLYC